MSKQLSCCSMWKIVTGIDWYLSWKNRYFHKICIILINPLWNGFLVMMRNPNSCRYWWVKSTLFDMSDEIPAIDGKSIWMLIEMEEHPVVVHSMAHQRRQDIRSYLWDYSLQYILSLSLLPGLDVKSCQWLNARLQYIYNWIMDIHNCKSITNKAAIMDIHNWIMDIHN